MDSSATSLATIFAPFRKRPEAVTGVACRAACRWLIAAIAASLCVMAHATPIRYTFTGTASGTLAGTAFSAAPFTLNAIGDTADVSTSGAFYCNHVTSLTFTLGGVASGALAEAMNLFVQTGFGAIGLQPSDACPGGGTDWLDSNAAAFTTYHLDAPIGPIALPATIFQFPVATTRGALALSTLTAAAFQASAASPAPEARAGVIDPTFGIAGQASYPDQPTTFAYVQAMAVQPDAKIVWVGYAGDNPGYVYRLTPSGLIDGSFGVGGTASALMTTPASVAVQADGKILVAGGSPDGITLARLTASGTPDPTFGPAANGTVLTSFGPIGVFVRKVLLQPDGRFIVVGTSSTVGSSSYNMLVVARYRSDGTLDPTFGGGGAQTFTAAAGQNAVPNDAALLADGSIVIGGHRQTPIAVPLLLKFTAAGQPDPSFITTTPAAKGFASITSVGAQADGKLVLTGEGASIALFLRLNADGSADATYATGGVLGISLASTTLIMQAAVLQPDGKVVALLKNFAGGAPVLARITAAGVQDATFGTAGATTIDAGLRASSNSLALQADGKILVGIENYPAVGASGPSRQSIFRFQGDPITGTIVEFFNAALNHYFITASAVEQASIDAGGSGPGWTRTGKTFKSGGVSRACRFYGTPGVGPNSHFYTLDPAECAQVRMDPGWHFESYDFSASPADALGGCPSGTLPVFRAYNHRFAQNDSNHRYAVDTVAYDTQVDILGWTGEGVVFCVPK